MSNSERVHEELDGRISEIEIDIRKVKGRLENVETELKQLLETSAWLKSKSKWFAVLFLAVELGIEAVNKGMIP